MQSYKAQEVAAHWDAGEAGCGHLAMGIAMALSVLEGGQTLLLIARGAGAPVDVPAWCRLTGHALISASHPNYLICKKGD